MTVGHPRLNPARRRLWRENGALQLGLDPSVAVVIDGVDPADAVLLDALDGSRDAAAAAGSSGDPDRAARVVAALRAAGALCPAADGALRARLVPDALAASLLHPDGEAVVTARADRGVTVVGAGRVGSALAPLLAAAGVGRVAVIDPALVGAGDLTPAGVRRLRGPTRADATREVVSMAGGDLVTSGRIDLVVFAPDGPAPAPEVTAGSHGLPHLLVCVREIVAVVGPLVIPGVTPCRRCAELARAERDPQWPWLSAQLAGETRRIEPCDVALAATAAGLAALHVLRHLDDPAAPHPLRGGIIELSMHDLRQRRRTVSAHPDCGCGAQP